MMRGVKLNYLTSLIISLGLTRKNRNCNSYVLFYPSRDIGIVDVPVRVLSVGLARLPVSGVEQSLAH